MRTVMAMAEELSAFTHDWEVICPVCRIGEAAAKSFFVAERAIWLLSPEEKASHEFSDSGLSFVQRLLMADALILFIEWDYKYVIINMLPMYLHCL